MVFLLLDRYKVSFQYKGEGICLDQLVAEHVVPIGMPTVYRKNAATTVDKFTVCCRSKIQTF